MKRLESSIKSFEITMGRTIDKIEKLESRITRFKQFQGENPDLDFDDLNINDIEDEELQEAMEVGEKIHLQTGTFKIRRMAYGFTKRQETVDCFTLNGKKYQCRKRRKAQRIKKLIEGKVRNPTITRNGDTNKKIIVFTAFSDTAEYLYNSLCDWITNNLNVHIALVTGGASNCKTTFMHKGYKGQSEFNHILTNFSPISKKRNKIPSMPQSGEIDILIATDCISEGQNLQDCDYLINYDIHWNPVKIIQRFGRIDRIGSINKSVQLVNFWPTDDLNKYLNLKTAWKRAWRWWTLQPRVRITS